MSHNHNSASIMSSKNKVNIPDSNFIRDMLHSCENAIAAINKFQIENGLQMSSLDPVFPLLDLHGVTRCQFHHSVIKLLRDKVNKTLPTLPRESLEKLLKQAFAQIDRAELLPVGLEIMKLLNPVPEQYLKKVAAMPEVYKQCSIEVKRQVWENNQLLFGDEVRPILNKYIWEKDMELHKGSTDDGNLNISLPPFFSIAPRKRRESEVIKQLREMIGPSFPLYQMMLLFVRTLYQRNKTPHFCTLRTDMLMTFHDHKLQDIYKQDPCHDFAFYIQFAVNERRVHDKIIPRLKQFYIKAFSGEPDNINDMAIILADPYVQNVFHIEIFSQLHKMVEGQSLPRDDEKLHFLLKFVNLGINSWSIVNDEVTEEPKLHKSTVREHLPLLMICLTEDLLHQELGSRYRDVAVSNLISAISKDRLVKCLLMHYVLVTAEKKNLERLIMMLPLIPESVSTLDEVFVHVLVSHLLQLTSEWAKVDFCKAVFTHFLHKYCSEEVMLRHVLRLLWTVHVHMPRDTVTDILPLTAPQSQHSKEVSDLFKQLSERIELAVDG